VVARVKVDEADRQRLAMLQRQEDEKRRAEIEAAQRAAKKKSEEEASAKAEVERQRLTILQYQQDEKKRVEEALKAGEVAVATLPKTDQEPSINAATLARRLQAELKRVGCDPGAVDGEWGAKPKVALREFGRTAKVTLSAEEPTEDALKSVTAQKGRICVLKCGANEKEKGGRCVANAKPERVRSRVEDNSKPKLAREQPSSQPNKGLCRHTTGGPTSSSVSPCP
jgi:hypothetical protein